jgi:hypothetical protein
MNILAIALVCLLLFGGLIFFTSLSTAFFILVIIVLIVLAIYKALAYTFNIDIFAKIGSNFMPQLKTNQLTAGLEVNEIKTELQQKGASTVPEIKVKEQVFNIPGNDYDYINAKALCAAYGARLATYPEIEDSYINGGEWCNYGWSDGQMALFPTQLMSYEKLQKIKGHEHDCGRPGINGGYIANPNVKFGVNCFGFKPKITTTEEEMMKNMVPYPKSMEDVLMEQKVAYWKTQINDILVSPFNYEYWSKLLTV